MNAPVNSGPRHLSVELPRPIISHTGTAALVEVFDQPTVAKCEGLVTDAALAITDAASHDRANGILLAVCDAEKRVEARRRELKAPIKQIGESIDEIARKLSEPLATAKQALKDKIGAHERAERAKADELRRQAEEAARKEREAQDAERRRLEAEALAKAQQEARDAAEVLGVEVEARPEPIAAPEVPVRQATVMPPATPAKPSVLQTRKDKRLVIDDAAKIPYRIGQSVLMLADERAIKAAWAAGVAVPGTRMVEVETTVMAGQRA